MSENREKFMALVAALGNELRMTIELQNLEAQFHRRLMVRVLFTAFEGYAFHLRRRALDVGNHARYQFSKTELQKLTEREEKRTPAGEVKVRSFYLRSKEAFTFSVGIFARVMGVPQPELPSVDDLDIAFAVRDRLTHPKKAGDFNITDTEYPAIARLAIWFSSILTWYSAAELAHIERIRVSISESFESQIAEMKAKRK